MKNPFVRLLSFAPSVVIVLLLSACGSTRIFHADFDADTVGALPNPNPPGPPTDDTIWSTAGSDTTMLSVVNDATIGSRSLRFANDGPIVRYVGFLSEGVSPTADHVYAYWVGKISSGPVSVNVWLGDTHFGAIGGLRFLDGQVQVRTGSGYETIGSYNAARSHVVVLGVDKTAGTYDVSFLQGPHSASRTNIPVINPTVMGTPRPTLYLAYLDTESGGTYVVDDVNISEREPEME